MLQNCLVHEKTLPFGFGSEKCSAFHSFALCNLFVAINALCERISSIEQVPLYSVKRNIHVTLAEWLSLCTLYLLKSQTSVSHYGHTGPCNEIKVSFLGP